MNLKRYIQKTIRKLFKSEVMEFSEKLEASRNEVAELCKEVKKLCSVNYQIAGLIHLMKAESTPEKSELFNLFEMLIQKKKPF